MNTAHFFTDPKIQQTVESFTNLLLCGRVIVKPDKFSIEDQSIIMEMIELAGYQLKDLEVSSLIHQCSDDNNYSFTINKNCPFIVLEKEGGCDLFATVWLDWIFSIAGSLRRSRTSHEEKEFLFLRELKESLPFQPIRISSDEDILEAFIKRPLIENGCYRFVGSTLHEEDKIGEASIGFHKHCGGMMSCMSVTKTHKTLVCPKCFLRIPFPKEVITYGDLKEYMENFI